VRWMRSIELHRLQHEPLVQRLENVSTGNKARADALDYIKRLCNAIRRHFDDWIYESYGVREAGWISLSGCQPNRVQLKTSIASADHQYAIIDELNKRVPYV
jgi:hypothetical protein